MQEISPLLTLSAQDKAIELLVVSLDGETENVLQRILDLPKSESEEIFRAVDSVSSGLEDEKKG